MNPPYAVLATALLGIALLSFFQFPGHTILQSDTQIYIPILEHIRDPSIFAKDFMATQPHVSFTFYDETTLFLRRITGVGFEGVLQGQQFVFRALGIVGLYLISTALGLRLWQACFVVAIVALGATVNGPAVLTVEYEPVPRGFALPFLLLSIGCAGHGRWATSALSATIAFGFHPPTSFAYCGLLFGVLVWERRYRDVVLLAIGPAALAISAAVGGGGHQPMFGTIPPELEALQRMRAAYNWVGIWIDQWFTHYALLWAVALLAMWRLREHLSRTLLVFFAGLPLIGVLSVPLSYVLLDRAKWVLIPQFQPGRYLLFVTLTAVLMGAAAAMYAAQKNRWWEAASFLTMVFAVPMDPNVIDALARPANLALAAGLALASALARQYALAPAVLAFFLIPAVTHVRNYPVLHHPELDQLAEWARTSTPKDALFQFADLGRDLSQGVFRARSLRALYVDWKAGGQVNFLMPLADTWRERWTRLRERQPLDTYRSLGIDYVIFKTQNAPPGVEPIYKNERYSVYRLAP